MYNMKGYNKIQIGTKKDLMLLFYFLNFKGLKKL